MKLLQIVWNFPDTVMRPFNMYYFYWPMREAVLRGWQAEVLTFQTNDSQLAEENIDGIRVRRCPAGVRKGQHFSWPFISALLTTDADIVYCHGYGEGRSELAILLSRLRGRKVIFAPYFHGPARQCMIWRLRAFHPHAVRCILLIGKSGFRSRFLCSLGGRVYFFCP